tara:strand:- start:881 stop:1858 length:978 start_codon:yes stop_codon:yes gene_type:complete
MTKLYFIAITLLLFVNGLCQANAQQLLHETALSYFSPLPKSLLKHEIDTPERIKLGQRLYFEVALSINQTQSCNSCHNIINGAPGVDHLSQSVGALGNKGTRNAPSTWNTALHVAQFWDGRAQTLEEQASFPIFNPNEMAMTSEDEVIIRLKSIGYLSDFQHAFPRQASPINIDNISNALASFQRTLLSDDRFDKYLQGDLNAINNEEKMGLITFISKGCVACHNGSALGGQLFMKMGIVHPYPNKIDKGRAQATGNIADSYFFKVPSLRNVLNTAPYFHDGAATTIDQAIEDTGWHQLGIRLTLSEIKAIKTFFNTLNNELNIE